MELNITSTELLTVDDIEFIQELSKYKFPNRVYKHYVHNTKDNENLTYLKAKNKLIRNIILSIEAPMIRGMEHKRQFYYGNLLLQLNIEEHSICYVKNKSKGLFELKVNKAKFNALNKLMGIK